MKVILEEGCIKPVVKTIFKTTCPICGCVFEFETDDFKTRVRSLPSNDSDTIGTISCPYCEKDFAVVYGGVEIRKEIVDGKTSDNED